MKKNIFIYSFVVAVAIVSVAARDIAGDCDIRSLKNEVLKSLKPDYR